ncbi:MAG: glutathione S-transferase [Verrucomicrobiota bacterium]|nr:glutathione S-transferase [Verrucomicrobiota bacterium]
MIELFQLPWSPYCLVIHRILQYSGTRFKVVDIPAGNRDLIWKITRERYYKVPVVRDGDNVIFETDENSQVIAKYLDQKLGLDLFPPQWEGVQTLLWRYFENDVESITFKLNDIFSRNMVPEKHWLAHLRHKERRFGVGCIETWKKQQPELLKQLQELLIPCEQMLATRPFLLDSRPLFVDFDLWGMLANFLYSGEYQLSKQQPYLREWHKRMSSLAFVDREKLHP